ncbi:extracellular solute-binding protein [Microvirga alba]|uniref:Extracellular solute-binding protein n=1 Tax=Microvirga alba TaxID=2791025 RepID=A0A931FUL0_9HYPH|nr:extracellular solute-binding protein [Microvirga alba]MBF9235716.1 extracellular solute-binding protein [Microvirga alba]
MRLKVLAIAVVLSAASGHTALAQQGNLVVYNPAGDAGEKLIDAFRAKYPKVSIAAINGGVGELFTRASAEKARPQGDVMVCASSEAYMANPDLFAPYKSAEADKFSKDVIGPNETYYGCSMPLQAFIVNTRLLSKNKLPKSWLDLAKPEYKGKIVLANPSLSGSAYAQLAQILQLQGWDTAKAIMANARFVTSSQSVFQDVARGEMEIGVTGEANIKPLINEGYPVAAVYPSDGTALRFDASAIIKGGPNPDNARLFLEFLNSKEAHAILASTNRRSVRSDIAAPEGLAPTSEIVTFAYDDALASRTRKENLARWDELFSR